MSRPGLIAMILVLGLAVRASYDQWFFVGVEPENLRAPLSDYPRGVFGPGWIEETVPLLDRVVQIAGVDDYLNRKFSRGGQEFSFYVGFYAGDKDLGTHHPGVCFPRQGLTSTANEAVRIRLDRFEDEQLFNDSRWTTELGGSLVCLQSFYIGGVFESDVDQIALKNRMGRISHHAVVMIVGKSMVNEQSTREFYREALRKLVPPLLDFFPLRSFEKAS